MEKTEEIAAEIRIKGGIMDLRSNSQEKGKKRKPRVASAKKSPKV